MKESKVEEFLRKVDRPWGMSMTELEQFQSEVKQLKSEQNKVAVEKLEEVIKVHIKNLKNSYKELSDFENGYRLACDDFKYLLESKIKELKGEGYGI